MFGWEFPPHVSGGLGTACFGLTKGLSETGGTDVLFIVPRAWGDEQQSGVEVVGANQIPVANLQADDHTETGEIKMVGVRSGIIPYTTPKQFWQLKKGHYAPESHFVEVDENGTIGFTGEYGTSLYREIRNYALVAEEIALNNQFDVIHAHDWMAFPAGIAAKKVTGKPLVVHVHSTDFDRSGGDVNSVVYSIEREGMEAADKVITVSNLTRNTVIEKYGIEPEKVVTVYNAVNPLPGKINLPIQKIRGIKTVTFMGRITRQKGPEYFVEVASLLLKRVPGVRFVMAGGGDLENKVIDYVARLGISDRFHFTGFLKNDEVYQLLDISDVFIMPSVSEPFGIAPLEAMQAGVPVIVSRQSGVAEIVNYVFKTDFWDTYAMADAIYGLLMYPALGEMFSKHGAVEAGNLEWKYSAGIISGIYSELIGKNLSASKPEFFISEN